MMIDHSDELIHYGTPRRSGRYPWGSGQDPMQGGKSFLGYVDYLKSKGMTDKEISRGLQISIADLRAKRSIALSDARREDAAQALRLKEKGWSNVAIGKHMGIPESSVRALTNPALAEKRDALQNVAKELKEKVDSGGMLDVSKGVENYLGVSATKLATSVAMLKQQGYVVRTVRIPQLGMGGGMMTTMKVLARPGTERSYIMDHLDDVKGIRAFSPDGGKTFEPIRPPVRVSSSRIGVRHKGEGGELADGVIYVRPGVPDLSLGGARYAQVRIAVDDGHYLKGMAIYKEGLPDGIDLMFNTGKASTGNKMDALKSSGSDAENPFGAVIRQMKYKDAEGNEHLSPMNLVNVEGDWRNWRPSLSSQVLSKQSTALARRQLAMALTAKKDELNEIRSLTNPTVKKKLLETFADSADSDAVHLRAHALPRQATHVILPFENIREGEIYAPKYNNGERVVLIRHPHGGPFEIPELVVNNRNALARATIGPDAKDAVGIHPNVAKILSGADFDGDAVLVIPNNRRDVRTSPSLEGLKDFDPKSTYPYREGMTVMTKPGTQRHMGDISNLITDMTIKGASDTEKAAAIRHSMVVIDAEKHRLDYTRSYRENGIRALKAKYQGVGPTGRVRGASTLISLARSQERIAPRKARSAAKGGPINPPPGTKGHVPGLPVGAKVYEEAGPGRKIKVAKLSLKTDAMDLSSGSPMEAIYAAHANSMKALANQARIESLRTGSIKYSPSARRAYAPQVKRLLNALDLANRNAPVERQAQLLARVLYKARVDDNPNMDDDDLKKARFIALRTARDRTGARKPLIDVDEKEWEAIQSGAISPNRLRQILNNADLKKIRKLATPKQAPTISTSRLNSARSKIARGYTMAEVARSLGVSVSTLERALSEGG